MTEEESQRNFEEKIKILADHCVKFMNGEVTEIKCLDFSSDIFFREKDFEANIETVIEAEIPVTNSNEKE